MRRVRERARQTPASDIGHRRLLQEKRGHRTSRNPLIRGCFAPWGNSQDRWGSPAPAGEEAAPATGLAVGGTDLLFPVFVCGLVVLDAGVVGRAHNRDDRWNA